MLKVVVDLCHTGRILRIIYIVFINLPVVMVKMMVCHVVVLYYVGVWRMMYVNTFGHWFPHGGWMMMVMTVAVTMTVVMTVIMIMMV